jgi:hypothetical protein
MSPKPVTPQPAEAQDEYRQRLERELEEMQ